MPVNNLMMQAERLHTRDLKSEQSPTRTEALTFRCDEWSVDLSKQYLDEVDWKPCLSGFTNGCGSGRTGAV